MIVGRYNRAGNILRIDRKYSKGKIINHLSLYHDDKFIPPAHDNQYTIKQIVGDRTFFNLMVDIKAKSEDKVDILIHGRGYTFLSVCDVDLYVNVNPSNCEILALKLLSEKIKEIAYRLKPRTLNETRLEEIEF